MVDELTPSGRVLREVLKDTFTALENAEQEAEFYQRMVATMQDELVRAYCELDEAKAMIEHLREVLRPRQIVDPESTRTTAVIARMM